MGDAARSTLPKATICMAAALGVLVLLVGLVRAGDHDRRDAPTAGATVGQPATVGARP
jgi:hypothetical protein